MASRPPGYDPESISLEAAADTREAIERARGLGVELDELSRRRAAQLVTAKPNRLALLARDPARIVANAEWLRKLCESYPDDGTARSCDPLPGRRPPRRPR